MEQKYGNTFNYLKLVRGTLYQPFVLFQLQNRLRDQVERKKKQVMAFKAGISPMGQKLFQAISKT